MFFLSSADGIRGKQSKGSWALAGAAAAAAAAVPAQEFSVRKNELARWSWRDITQVPPVGLFYGTQWMQGKLLGSNRLADEASSVGITNSKQH